MSKNNNLIDGFSLQVGGQEYIIPPLNFSAIKRFQKNGTFEIANGASGSLDAEKTDAMIDLIHAAMTRNYPDMTREEVEDVLDMGNMATIINAVMGRSGMVAAGEVLAGN